MGLVGFGGSYTCSVKTKLLPISSADSTTEDVFGNFHTLKNKSCMYETSVTFHKCLNPADTQVNWKDGAIDSRLIVPQHYSLDSWESYDIFFTTRTHVGVYAVIEHICHNTGSVCHFKF